MKKTAIVLLVLVLAMLMSACASPDVTPTPQDPTSTNLEKGNNYNADMENVNVNQSKGHIWPWEDPSIVLPPFSGETTPAGSIKSLKVLALGDSSSKDSLQFLAKLALEAGIKDVKVGMLYRNGGGALDGQCNDFKNNTASYTYHVDTGDGWVSTPNAKAQDVLKSEKWDVVIVHQNLCNQPDAKTYGPLTEFVNSIDNILRVGTGNANKNADAKIYFMQVWAYEINNRNNLYNHTKYYQNPTTKAYDQKLMHNTAVDTIKAQVVPQKNIDGVIPVGTAIQNMRESYWSDGMTKDAEFLSNTGKVAAAVAMFKFITGYDINGMTLSDPVFDHARTHIGVIIESANNAYLNPFATTPSVYHVDN